MSTVPNQPAELRIFLSSTFSDLWIEREAVEAVINRMSLLYVGMEHFGSFSEEPIERCLEKVRNCHLFLLVLGQRYGSLPTDRAISFTEAEYREAERLKKSILAYFAHSYSEDSRQDDDPRLTSLKSDIANRRGVSRFESPEELAWKVACDLYRELPRLSTRLDGLTDDLVSIFEHRASVIERTLISHYQFAPVKQYLDEFRTLHEEHLRFLRDGNLVLAHEFLCRIHEMSFRLERDEFWTCHHQLTPGLRYSLEHDAFTHGPIATVYGRGGQRVRPTMLMRGQKEENAVDLYERVLADGANT
jgi:Domain of unknown function (DUF4062)